MASGAAADKDGEVTIPLLENYLKKDVPTTVKDEKGLTVRQVPERLGDLRGLGLLAKFAVVREPKAGEEREFEIAKGVKMIFCWIPAGKATLGSPVGEKERDVNEKEHEYETKGFWLGKYEVTERQWSAVCGLHPISLKNFPDVEELFAKHGLVTRDLNTSKLPVVELTWHDCQKFIAKCKVKGYQLKLPHEDEWEYACRGGLGNKRAFYWGDELRGDKANCNGNSPYGTTLKGTNLEKVTEVGSYEKVAPHPWGLCDMNGNVSEWCENLHTPTSPARVFRGGSWVNGSGICRSAFRYGGAPSYAGVILGLRLALMP